MNRISIRALPIFIFLLFHLSNSENNQVKQSLVEFMDKLAAGNVVRDKSWGWNMTSDPCEDKWLGVSCDSQLQSIKKVVLDELNLTGVLDIASVCSASSLSVLSLENNNVVGGISEEIGNCKRLTHLYLSGNQLSGGLPEPLKQLGNLKRFDISDNNFTGEVPDLSRISGLITFLVQNNQLGGEIPNLDFSNLKEFNVSNNNFSGPIPDVKGRFSDDSFSGNPQLCGELVSKACPPSAAPGSRGKSKHSSTKQFLIYSGYVALGLIVVLFVALKIFSNNKAKQKKGEVKKKRVEATSSSSNKTGSASTITKTTEHRSEYSVSSVDSGMALSSLVVLSSPTAQGLRFEDLLRAPAELLGKGKHGSLYKVMLDNGETTLAVKRIRDWSIKSEDVKRRMQRLDQARHTNVLPSVAFYCSKQEKLLVYEYQPNGSLFGLLRGSQNGQAFDWGSRLNVASAIAEALTFMHEDLREDGIAHGNLKSTNILFDKDMDACISEYGLMVMEMNEDGSFHSQSDSLKNKDLGFKADIYGFGVILLELLTGKLVHYNGFDLGRWVNSVVREEWTVEVFDKALILEGASEERMLNLLQIALKCINPNPHERPSINQVALMISTLKDEEDRSSCEP